MGSRRPRSLQRPSTLVGPDFARNCNPSCCYLCPHPGPRPCHHFSAPGCVNRPPQWPPRSSRRPAHWSGLNWTGPRRRPCRHFEARPARSDRCHRLQTRRNISLTGAIASPSRHSSIALARQGMLHSASSRQETDLVLFPRHFPTALNSPDWLSEARTGTGVEKELGHLANRVGSVQNKNGLHASPVGAATGIAS